MKRLSWLMIIGFVMMIALSSCGPRMTTKISEFPGMYEEKPLSILILPPINETTAADAKEYYATTIQEPLAYKGFYVLPYPITSEILKMEGIYDAELLKDVPLEKFKTYFGADAVLFTTIKKWDMAYAVIAAALTVSIDCQLKSTTSNRVLWQYTGTVTVDLSGGNAGGGIAAIIVKAIVTAVNSAMADYVPYARKANYIALQTIPYGKYHRFYGKDQKVQFVDLTPDKDKDTMVDQNKVEESTESDY